MTDVSIVMPCLNEAQSLRHCVTNAMQALAELQIRFGLVGEVIVADNGSTDGSQELATGLGARVVLATTRGYGAALIAGFEAARGRYLVMGDADGSYDFRDAVGMVEALVKGADLCMGSRFKGGIATGAMPWKNRYIGNPVLTGLLNLFYGTRVSDAHCGLRALSRRTFKTLKLDASGMEFASEMVVKAALRGLVIAEVPATLSRDLRDRPPHLRPWRDGWRHLRFLLLLSPTWLFAVPALAMLLFGLFVMSAPAIAPYFGINPAAVGAYWTILAGACISLGHQGLLLALAAELAGIRKGFRAAGPLIKRLEPVLSLEAMIVVGVGLAMAGLSVLIAVVTIWAVHQQQAFANVLPAVGGTTLLTLGLQNILGGCLLAVLAGSGANLLQSPAISEVRIRASQPFKASDVSDAA
ncbi:MAG: glycosyltransferase [Methylocystis sp.]|nr:glycosyltransferase [Methylocystis sp.]MCA3587491.1 glycosyltransferase [Methylocystis sp.]MCA3591018.1 glycosyltransferase [Methylocystis sp.]